MDQIFKIDWLNIMVRIRLRVKDLVRFRLSSLAP